MTMRTLVCVAILAMSVGCNKPPRFTGPSGDTQPTGQPQPQSTNKTYSNPQGNLTGGSGGIFAPRTAAARAVNQAQLRDLHLSMSQTFLLDNRVPSKDEIMKDAQMNPQLLPLLKDEIIVLTGTTSGDGIWAYTMYPQKAQEHFVVTKAGVVQMTADDLKRQLELQKSEVKLAK